MNQINTLNRENILFATTEKDDNIFANSGSFCLDFFSFCGGMRHNYKELNNLFLRSYYENKLLTIKTMLFLRDIHTGLGERNSFRMTFNLLCNLDPDLAKQLLPLIPKYGRWDDILSGLNTKVEDDVIKLIKKILIIDLKKQEEGKEVSLLSKWLPSINASSKETRKLAKKIANKLGYTYEEYRKVLSKLRKGKIIESYLSRKDYSFDYFKIPIHALNKYLWTFYRKDYGGIRGFL